MDDKTREFLENLIKAFDEIAGRITYFISYSTGMDDAKAETNCSTPEQEDFMKYNGVKIKQRKDGRWYARIVIKPCHYHIIYGRTQLECYEKTKEFFNKPRLLKSMRRRLEEREKAQTAEFTKKLPTKYGRCKLKDWYDYWLKTFKIPNCKSSTISFIKYLYNNHIAKLAECTLNELSGIVIQSFIAEVPTSSMRKKVYTVLKDMIRKAYASEIIKRDPFLSVVPPKHKDNEQRALDPPEQQRFIERAKHSEYYPIYALMLFEGLRTAEAKAIRHCDIKEDCVIVRAALSEKNEIIDTKTGNIRRVPIFAAFRPIADALRSDSTELIAGKPSKHTANDEYREIMTELGMDYNMYALRHTFATNCARAGINTKQVALWMGHSNVTMTLKYYTNISDSFEEENVRRLDTNFDTNLRGKPQQ